MNRKKLTSLFDLPGQKTEKNPPNAKTTLEIVKVLSAQELLKTPIRTQQLKEIHTRVNLAKNYFDALYTPVLNNLAEYLQSLPDTVKLYQVKGGLLTYSLERCVRVLRLREKHAFSYDENPMQKIDSEKPLWTYVVCTATLLRDVGIIATNYPVQLVTQQGDFVKEWSPFDGSMIQQDGKYYLFKDLNPQPLHFSLQSTPMLARRLLPKEGFDWIASDHRALKAWIAILCGDDRGGGGVSLLLRMAEQELALAIAAKNEPSVQETVLVQDAVALPPDTFKEVPDMEVSTLFTTWLKDNLANGTITVNQQDSRIHTTEEGIVLIYAEIFQDFCAAYPRYKDWAVLYRQFNHIGLSALSGDDNLFYRFFGSEDPSLKSATPAAKGLLLSQSSSFLQARTNALKTAQTSAAVTKNPVAKTNPTIVLVPPQLPPLIKNPTSSRVGPGMIK